jgi:hypothetical protein
MVVDFVTLIPSLKPILIKPSLENKISFGDMQAISFKKQMLNVQC